MRKTLPAICFFYLFCSLPHASAHYLWVLTTNQGGEHGVANIYFEESPSAGDGRYLDHFTKTSKTWFRTTKKIKPELIEPSDIRKDKKRWLGNLDDKKPEAKNYLEAKPDLAKRLHGLHDEWAREVMAGH